MTTRSAHGSVPRVKDKASRFVCVHFVKERRSSFQLSHSPPQADLFYAASTKNTVTVKQDKQGGRRQHVGNFVRLPAEYLTNIGRRQRSNPRRIYVRQ